MRDHQRMEGSSIVPGGVEQPGGDAPGAEPERYVAAVWTQAESVARMYLEGERHGQPMTLEQKQFIEGIIAADYDGRTVIELLQNGHDAHRPDASDGKLEFLLDELRGPHGTLYVANGGNPVSDRDFAGMCRIAMSEKRPDAGIGNKGVGFKSVLQLSDSPEVYSAAAEGAGSFAGYRFRFARPEDFDTVAKRIRPGDCGLGRELRGNVSSLKITVPLDATPADVERFADEGYSTVIRLELRSPAALEAARCQLEELASSDVPINLFLPRLASITIAAASSSETTRHTLTYRRQQLPSPAGIDLYQVELQGGDVYLLLERIVTEQQMLAAIEQARRASRLNSAWDQWKGDARVSVALPLSHELEKGRIYTFLPMDEAAGALLPGFVNAPFFARLDRRSLDRASPLNRLLLDEIAALCAEALLHVQNGDVELPGDSAVDLLTCDAQQLSALRAALQKCGTDLAGVRVVPVLGARPRAALADCWIWQPKGSAFTPHHVAHAGEQGLVDPAIGAARWQRLGQLASLLHLHRRPRPTDIARFAETYAARLAARAASTATTRAWSAFLDDLAAEVPSGEALRGRRILLDSGGSLAATNDPSTDGARLIYFVPTTRPATPPAAIKTRLAFLHPEIAPAARGGREPGRSRRWLESQRLVREYRTEAVLDLVGATMRVLAADNVDRTNDRALRECLKFGYQIWRDARRDISPHAAASARLLLPTRSGWLLAAETVFGTGWGGNHDETDKVLAQLLERASGVSSSLRRLLAATLLDPRDLADVGETAELRRFCEELGASHGLVPAHFPRAAFEITGRAATRPRSLPNFRIQVSAVHQQAWRSTAASRAPAAPTYTTVPYRPDTDVAYLPGQFEWDRLDQRARLDYVSLVLRGLETWADSDLEFHYVRSGDGTGPVWPTYVASFLASEAWVPQTTPQDRTAIQFLPVAQAWWLQTEQTPDFLPAQPNVLRALTGPTALRRLTSTGLRYWDHPATATARLATLAAVVAEREPRLSAALRHAVRKAYERAWGDLCATDSAPAPHTVLVSAGGRYAVVDLDHDPDTVYVGDRSGEAQRRLLSQTSARLVPVRDAALGSSVLDRLRAAGLSTVRGTSQAAVIVTVDGDEATTLPARPLHDWGGQWLELLVAGIIEFRYNEFPPVPDDKITHARRRVRDATVVTGDQLATLVDGHATTSRASGSSYLLSSPTGRLAVSADHTERWALLTAAADGLAQLIDLPTLSGELKLALLTLEQRCAGRDPTDRDLAEVLSVSPSEIEALHASHSPLASSIERLIPVLAMLDPAIAESLAAHPEAVPDKAALLQWLAAHLPAGTPDPRTLLELADREDLLAAARQLNLPLGVANRGLRTLGRAPLHNTSGQRQQFDAFLARTRGRIQGQLRDRFRDRHDQQQPVDDYLRLRELPGLEPDPHWLDEYWDLPEDLLAAHIDAWIDAACPPTSATAQVQAPLPAVDVLRERGRRTVTETLSRARPLVDAWLHRNAAGIGPRPGDAATVTAAITAAGQMDFGTLHRRDVLAWLRDHGQWPAAMPLTTQPTELGLARSDIDQAAQRLQATRDSVRRQAIYVTYGNKTFSAEPEELAALADAVRGGISAKILDTPPHPVLPEVPQIAGETSGGGSSTGGGPWRGQSLAAEKAKAIGLAGEILAGQWIEHHYGLSPEATWVSGYRQDILADGKGSDALGYDFEVATSGGKILYEVKSTADDTPQLALGESEVRRASDLADDEDYRILFITHVLDPERQRIYPLPNPLAAGMLYFHLAGRTLRLQFTLPPDP